METGPKLAKARSLDEAKIQHPPCNQFHPQKWRRDTCSECFHRKLDHADHLMETGPKLAKARSLDEAKIQHPPCNQFHPQKWRRDTCSECFHRKLDHAQSLLEDAITKQDPTEVLEIMNIVGYGSFGSVYRCREKESKQIYAVKFLQLNRKQNAMREIVNEINILKSSIECPYIVEYSGCYMKDDVLMMVMEYCHFSVADLLDYNLATGKLKLSENQIAALCAGLIKGLAYLHDKDVTHRDIKPGNILLTDSGVRLADFGISVQLRNETEKMKALAGSPYWCAPEVLTEDSYDKRVDIWSSGIVGIEMAEGRPPLWTIAPFEVIHHIPKNPPPQFSDPQKYSVEFRDFVSKCLKKNPKDRLSPKEFLNHPFILLGSNAQIIENLVKEALPLIDPWKKRILEAKQLEEAKLQKGFRWQSPGSVLTIDTTSFQTHAMQGLRKEASPLQKLVDSSPIGKRREKKVFGAPLEKSLKAIPCAPLQLIDYIQENLLDLENVFSVEPHLEKTRMAEIVEIYEDGKQPKLSSYHALDVPAALKFFIVELPEPVVPTCYFLELMATDSKFST
eukprot:TRINITY_DN4840_c0_g1_i4.p1 TRINITY_DN4840_c0_g1~~TRINITY_DN4840_c0_g1_i4.p1  ORF type:complete len:573 (+),score=136.23 TRINITY_DN4840_c0_g1_i4:33-1721(+)